MAVNMTDNALELGTLMFGWLDYTMFAMMLGLSVVVGIWFGVCGRAQNIAQVDYLMGGKTMSTFPVAISLIASHISGITLMGVPAEIYVYGTMYSMVVVSAVTTCLAINYFFLPVFYGLQLTSTYEYLELRFNRSARVMASLLFTLSLLLYIPIVMYLPSLAFSQVSGLSVHLISPVVCMVCIFYTMVGGLKAVVWTDFLQAFVTVAACVAVGIIGVIDVGGFRTVWERSQAGGRLEFFELSPSPFKRSTLWTVTIGATFGWLCNIAASQGTMQRFLALPNINSAKWTLASFSLGIIVMKAWSSFMGLVIYATYYDCDPLKTQAIDRSDELLPYYVMKTVGHIPGLPGLFVAGVFSAALSSMSTALNSLSGTIYEDFVRPLVKTKMSDERINLFMKIIVVVLGGVCVGMVFVVERMGGMLELSYSIGGIVSGALVGIFTLGVLFPWANAKGALVGSVTSMLFMSWVVLGSQHAVATGRVVHPGLNTSTEGCGFNFTEKVTPVWMTERDDDDEGFLLYRLSYLLYCMVGTLVVIIVGMAVSFATGPRNPQDMDPALFAPVVRRFLGLRAASAPSAEKEFMDTKPL